MILTKIVLASDNAGKLQEITGLLSDLPVALSPQSAYHVPPVEETGLSFVENAILKARHAAKFSKLPAIADDSGLVVDALGGAPGIYSARFAGSNANATANIEKLLTQMREFPPPQRTACFYCAIAFIRDPVDPVPVLCQGKWEGQITTHPKGKNGFGYDPIFFIPELNCTAAELSANQKNALSHRGIALSALKDQFKKIVLHPSHAV